MVYYMLLLKLSIDLMSIIFLRNCSDTWYSSIVLLLPEDWGQSRVKILLLRCDDDPIDSAIISIIIMF